MLAIIDFAHAHKHIGMGPESTRFAVIALSDRQGAICLAYLNAHPFGSRRAPANWALVTQFVVSVLRKVYRARLGIYAGDLFCRAPGIAIESARRVVKELRALVERR